MMTMNLIDGTTTEGKVRFGCGFDRELTEAEWALIESGTHPLDLPGIVPYEVWELPAADGVKAGP